MELLNKFVNKLANFTKHFTNGDGAIIWYFRERKKSGSVDLARGVRLGPNRVHLFCNHADGSFTDYGVSHNLLTNIGCMVLLGQFGNQPAGNTLASNISTGTSGTTITGTGSVWTASNLATPTLGAAGCRVYCNANTTTLPTVWGNVISNTTNVLTVDKWWKHAAAAGGSTSNPPITGTTPTSGDAFVLAPGGLGSVQFMGMTTNASAAAATNTALTGEVTSNGGDRAFVAFARGSNPSGGSGSITLSKAFSITGTITAIHRGGLFSALSAAGADPLIFETVFNADATVVNGDTLTPTWTATLAG